MNIKLIVLLVLTAVFVAACGQEEQTQPTVPSTPEDLDEELELPTEPMEGSDDGVREFRFTGHMFYFEDEDGVQNPDMTVNVGDRVRIVFDNVAGIHDWVVDEIPGAQTEILQPGQSETIEFTVTEAGEFEYYCSYMRHREMGMVGKFIVQ